MQKQPYGLTRPHVAPDQFSEAPDRTIPVDKITTGWCAFCSGTAISVMGHCVFDSREGAQRAQETLIQVSDVALRLEQHAYT